MPEFIKNCPLCLGNEHQVFESTKFREQMVVNQICRTCGFVYQSPRMTRKELDSFYAKEYRQVYQGSEGPTRKDLRIQSGRADALLAFIRPLISSVNRHLDIGSSAGILLQTFKGYFQNHPVGIEPGESYRNYSKNQELQVYGDLQEIKDGHEERFDLVSMGHVLEHIPNPVAYLVELRERFLTTGGYLLVEVPNLYFHDCFEIAHMSSFSSHTLKQTIGKAGYDLVAEMKHGRPRSKLLPLYITVLARVGSPGPQWKVVSENRVKIKRKLGMYTRRIIQRTLPGMAWITEN